MEVRPFTILGFLLAIALGVVMGWYTISRVIPAASIDDTRVRSLISSAVNATSTPTPTPVPFRELTVPYLREQRYDSRLGERTLVSDAGSYRSYLTSYTSDGLRINALLTLPNGEKPPTGWPAVVFIHGYIPPAQYATLERYGDYIDYIARNGFAVLKIDLRGHGESEGEPSGAYYSGDYIIDTLNAYAALQAADDIDGSRIGLWGHSMAGNIVMRAMAAKPDIPAGVIWGGAVYTYTDFLQYRITDSSYVPPASNSPAITRRSRIVAANGDISADNPYWRQVAPATYLGELKGAVQLHHAVDDDVVSIEYSRNLTKLMKEAGTTHESYEYATGGHNIVGISFVQAMEGTVQFYKKYLLPEANPSPPLP
jgi:dipeptidyl aminopeptidase/acylaminoacyl peptidase